MLDSRIDKINSLIFDIAAGNFKTCGDIKGEKDELDAVITGINMLAEELEKNTVPKHNLKKMFEGIPDMVFMLNSNGHILDINSRVTLITGYTHKMLKNNTFNILFSLKYKFNISDLISFLNTYHKKENIPAKLITAEKSNIPVNCSFSLLPGNDSKDNVILLVVKNLSEVQLVKKELEDRNQELNTFIYRASHDLRGPLATIMGLFNLLDLEENDPEVLKNYLQLIKESSRKLHNVLDELLDLGRITAAGFNYQQIMVIDVLNQIIENNRSTPAFQKSIFTITDTQDNLIYSEPQILQSILYSLIDNSIKYCNPQVTPDIKIEVMDSSRGVKINITDNGIGIPNCIRNKIFNMFYRGNNISKGSGLGLYIVKMGVEKLGGKIWLKSTPEKGSTFSIYLPHKHLQINVK